MKEQALLMQHRDDLRRTKQSKISDYEDMIYKPNEVSNFIKLFMMLSEQTVENAKSSIKTLKEMEDNELESLLSEDDMFELKLREEEESNN